MGKATPAHDVLPGAPKVAPKVAWPSSVQAAPTGRASCAHQGGRARRVGGRRGQWGERRAGEASKLVAANAMAMKGLFRLLGYGWRHDWRQRTAGSGRGGWPRHARRRRRRRLGRVRPRPNDVPPRRATRAGASRGGSMWHRVRHARGQGSWAGEERARLGTMVRQRGLITRHARAAAAVWPPDPHAATSRGWGNKPLCAPHSTPQTVACSARGAGRATRGDGRRTREARGALRAPTRRVRSSGLGRGKRAARTESSEEESRTSTN